MNTKRAHGQFYTKGNPFELKPFRQWAEQAGLSQQCVLEPFAGGNHIIDSLQGLGICRQFKSYDLNPASPAVHIRDTITDFPKGFSVCVTNPPWLAKNSATRRKLPFPQNQYDDRYKHCLQLCLRHCDYVAALLPASYLKSNLFQERLSVYILLHQALFAETENPVCLALFAPQVTETVEIYYDNEKKGTLAEFEKHLPRKVSTKYPLVFNDPEGQLGFVSFDNTKEASIRFCQADEIKHYQIKISSRFFTCIKGDFPNLKKLVAELNHTIRILRQDTHDLFLTPFKGMRQDGQYRRRMDFSLARRIISAH